MTALTNGENDSPMVKPKIHTVDQLTEAFGGAAEMAEWAGLGSTAILNWAARSFIPPGWHLRIYAEACRRGLNLDLEALFGLSDVEIRALRMGPAASPASQPKPSSRHPTM